jgi:hypothetical protein
MPLWSEIWGQWEPVALVPKPVLTCQGNPGPRSTFQPWKQVNLGSLTISSFRLMGIVMATLNRMGLCPASAAGAVGS